MLLLISGPTSEFEELGRRPYEGTGNAVFTKEIIK